MGKTVGALAAAVLMQATAAVAANWADVTEWPEFADSKAICRAYPAVRLPPAPPARVAADCNAEALYYGLDGPPDPAAAYACARREAASGPFAGGSLLMTMFANGIGVERSLDTALALACSIGGAPAEVDGRVRHLRELKSEGWTGRDFHWCDDVTSGVAQGDCAAHFQRVAEARRKTALAKLARKWTGPLAAPFDRLRQAAASFTAVRSGSEVDQSGTARAAMTIGEEEAMNDEFLDDLQTFAAGRPPCAGAERETDADARLNAAFKAVMKIPAERAAENWGSVTLDDIRRTQKAWLPYRDAWVEFVAAAYPQIPQAAVVNWLTLRRLVQIQDFLNLAEE